MRHLALAMVTSTIMSAAELPLVLHLPMDGGSQGRGGIGLGVSGNAATPGEGRHGGGLVFSGQGRLDVSNEGDPRLSWSMGSPLTIGLWIKPSAYPKAKHDAILVSKRLAFWHGYTFRMLVSDDGTVRAGIQNAPETFEVAVGKAPLGEWTHITMSHAPDGDLVVYRNGVEAGRTKTRGTAASNDMPIVIGNEDGMDNEGCRRDPYRGSMDDLRIYSAVLTPAQVTAMRDNQALPDRPATPADRAPNRMPLTLKLVRFDIALGFQNRDGHFPALTRQPCRRIDGPDAVDWPLLTVGSEKLFEADSTQQLMWRRATQQRFGPLFQQPDDAVVKPGNHWFRPLEWLWGHTYVYTTDPASRGSGMEGEIWTFPVKLAGAPITTVKLTCGGAVLFAKTYTAPLTSLTLCLPQNLPGPKYELAINGGKAIAFDAGLKPVVLGDPREEPLPIQLDLGGGITAKNLDVPELFTFAHDLKKQTADMRERSAPWAKASAGLETARTLQANLGSVAPRAPIMTYSVSCTHGMSGGHWLDSLHGPDHRYYNGGKLWPGSATDYAGFLAAHGYDAVIEMFAENVEGGKRTTEQLATACEASGVKIAFNAVSVANANQMYYSRVLADFWLPKLRDLQIITQRMRHHGNLLGITFGGDNAGYVPYWDWAPPIGNRPWAESFLHLNNWTKTPSHPIGSAIPRNPAKSHEVPGTQKSFVDYMRGYDATFSQFGQYQARIREVEPRLMLSTQGYGSAPGGGGAGGWPWATIPGRDIFRDLAVTQAYDWDETPQERPLHNLALIDRLRSWYPEKPAWALHDDFYLKYNLQARQRIIALSLAHGAAGVGFNWMPQPSGEQARPDICEAMKTLWSWVHRSSGAYAGTRLQAPIGIVFSHEQANSRHLIADWSSAEALLKGPQEGKAVEALYICHLAGIPARIVTTDEIKRGLPSDMQALLLTGLNRFDTTWLWSDGLESQLKAFAGRGGRFLLDQESVLPDGLSGAATGLQVHAYAQQGDAQGPGAQPGGCKVAQLTERNRDNATKLKAAFGPVTLPCTSAEPTVWAVPHRTGDVSYVTVSNWGFEPGKPALRTYKPVRATLAWTVTGPIFDLTTRKQLTPAEAADCDLTADAVRLYACPPAAPESMAATTAFATDGAATITLMVSGGGKPMAGIPLELALDGPAGKVTIYGASGAAIRLPLTRSDAAGSYAIAVSELLSGKTAKAVIAIDGKATAATSQAVDSDGLKRFLTRTKIPLVLGLTRQQAADAPTRALADTLAAQLAKLGRKPEIRSITPDELIVGLQTYSAAQRHPQWQTIPADLVLLGDLKTNVLIYDQALGDLYTPEVYRLQPGQHLVRLTYSPFVGTYNCLNLLGAGVQELTAAVQAVR